MNETHPVNAPVYVFSESGSNSAHVSPCSTKHAPVLHQHITYKEKKNMSDDLRYCYSTTAGTGTNSQGPSVDTVEAFVRDIGSFVIKEAGDKEVKHIQPKVHSILEAAVKRIDLKLNDYEFDFKGSIFHASYKMPGPQDLKKPRVFSPLSGTPDVEVKWCLPGVSKFEDFACIPAEVKPPTLKTVVLGDTTSYAHLNQTVSYGVRFLLRVFPMLAEEDLLKVFPDRNIYIPLMSNQEMVLAKISAGNIGLTGKITVEFCNIATGNPFAEMILLWVNWAVKASKELSNFSNELRNVTPINSWVPQQVFKDIFQIGESVKLVPAPSFFNPLYYSVENGHVLFPH